MTLAELKMILEATGIPIAYRFFTERQAPPFICYYVYDTDNIGADGGVYYEVSNVRVELYTELKNQQLEKAVETVLTGFFYNKSETYISTEKVYQIIYEIEV